MDIYDPIGKALGLEPMHMNYSFEEEFRNTKKFKNCDKIVSPFAGQTHTEETLKLLRVPKSEEHKLKISKGNKGKHKPEPALIASQAAAKVNTGKKRPEHGKRIKELWESGRYNNKSGKEHPRYGKKHSEETKAKIRAARLGKKYERK